MVDPPLEQARWFEERLRYQVLRFVFDQIGPRCDVTLTGRQIRDGLALGADELLRMIEWLVQHGYVRSFGNRPDVCLTPRAVTYFEEGPERRRSLRG